MLFEGKRVTWNDIVDVYNADCKHGESRILHKLTDQHVIPEKIKKMKVTLCIPIPLLSKTTSFSCGMIWAFLATCDWPEVAQDRKLYLIRIINYINFVNK